MNHLSFDEQVLVERPETIEPKHWKEWAEGSGVSPEITSATLQSVSDRKQIRKFLGWKQYPSKNPLGWIAYSGEFDGTRSDFWGQFKPDEKISINGKDAKYLTPSVAAVTDQGEGIQQDCFVLPIRTKEEWTNIIQDVSVVVDITEGFKKAGTLETHGCVSIGFVGVNRWHEKNEPYKLYPKLRAIAKPGRTIRVNFDADWRNNPSVREQMLLLGEVLSQYECTVVYRVWELTENTKGIDDLIVTYPENWREHTTEISYERLIEINEELKEEIGKQRSEKQEALLAEFEAFKQKYGYSHLKIEFKEGEEGNLIPVIPMQKFFLFDQKFTGRIRYNQMLDDYEFDGKQVDWNTIRLDLEAWGFELTFQAAEEFVRKVGDRDAYSPVANYLNSLPEGDANYLNELASKYFGVPVTDDLSRMYLRKWLIGAVRRALEPGTLVDYMIVLIGKQGCGKSQFFRRLAGDNFFTDTFGCGADVGNKDELSKLREHWILELGELDYLFSKSQTEQFKRFLSTTKDCYRRSYGRGNKSYPRACAFAGTSNQRELLRDETGNRRYLVVEIPEGWRIPFTLLDSDRDKIWAAALAAYKAGENHFLEAEYQEALSQRNEHYQSTDPWQDIIEQWLEGEGQTLEYLQGNFVLQHVLKLDPAHMDQKSQNRLSRILAGMGWKKVTKRHQGKSFKAWVKEDCNGCNGSEASVTGLNAPVTGLNSIPVTPQNSHFPNTSEKCNGCNGSSIRETEIEGKNEENSKTSLQVLQVFDNFSDSSIYPQSDPLPVTLPENADSVSVSGVTGLQRVQESDPLPVTSPTKPVTQDPLQRIVSLWESATELGKYVLSLSEEELVAIACNWTSDQIKHIKDAANTVWSPGFNRHAEYNGERVEVWQAGNNTREMKVRSQGGAMLNVKRGNLSPWLGIGVGA